MVQLSLGMLERYEIPNRRPGCAQALLLGADRLMLGCAAPLLDAAGMGACCVCEAADALRAQDGMYTLLLRGEREDGGAIREECVIQSICQVCAPERDFSAAEAGRRLCLRTEIYCKNGKSAAKTRWYFSGILFLPRMRSFVLHGRAGVGQYAAR